MRELIARTVFWKLRLSPLRSVPRAMLSCFDGTDAHRAVGRNHRSAEIVRHAAALVLGVRLVAVLQRHGAQRRACSRASTTTTSPPVSTPPICVATASRFLAGLPRRDEARDVDSRAVAVERRRAAARDRRRATQLARPSLRRV